MNSHQLTAELNRSGAALALRALGYGSLYAVLGCSALFFTIWKITGANDLNDFRLKAGSILPRIPKNDPPVGRTEFTGTICFLILLSLFYFYTFYQTFCIIFFLLFQIGINDFLSYVIEEDKKNQNSKKNN